MLYLDGVYAEDADGKIRFHRIKAPTVENLGVMVNRISRRVVEFLERRGFLERDDQSHYLMLETSKDEGLQQLYGHSDHPTVWPIGAQPGRRVLTLQRRP